MAALYSKLSVSFREICCVILLLPLSGGFLATHAWAADVAFFGSYEAGRTQIWRTDGSTAGTKQIATNKDFGRHGNAMFLGQLGQSVLFTEDAYTGNEQLLSVPVDGLEAKQLDVKVSPNTGGVGGGSFVLFDGAARGENKDSLWRTDGSVVGTQRILDLAGTGFGYIPSSSPAFSGNVTFVAKTAMTGPLAGWVSDGTAAGTHKLMTTEGGSEMPLLGGNYTLCNNALFFIGTRDRQDIWTTDGTPDGTKATGIANRVGQPAQIACVNDAIFFSGLSANHSAGLWRWTIGSPEPAKILDGTISELMPFNGGVVFQLGVNPGALWFVDKDAKRRKITVFPSSYGSFSHLKPFNGALILITGPSDVWISDLSAAGTRRITPETVHFSGSQMLVAH